MDRRERIIELATKIGNFRTEISELKDLIAECEAELDQLLPADVTIAAATIPPNGVMTATISTSVPSTASPSMAVTDRIIRLLEGTPGRYLDAEHVRDLLNLEEGKMKSLRSTLQRLAEEKRIRRVKRGRYAARTKAAENSQAQGSKASDATLGLVKQGKENANAAA